MRRLLVLRHAKSSWDDPRLDDFERPLNARGRAAAPSMGREIARRGLTPALIVASPARRTAETVELAAPFLAPAPELRLDPGLYLASAEAILDRIRYLPDDADSAMIVGHNPGLEEAALALAGGPGAGGDAARIAEKFPTAAVAAFDFDARTWRDAAPKSARIRLFLRPRDLGA